MNPQETNPLEDTLQHSCHFVQNRPKLKQLIKRRKSKHIMRIHMEACSTAAMEACHGEQPRGPLLREKGSKHRATLMPPNEPDRSGRCCRSRAACGVLGLTWAVATRQMHKHTHEFYLRGIMKKG